MVSNNIKTLIYELGISQRQFALKIGFDPAAITKLFTNQHRPSERMLNAIEKTFDVNRSWLETGRGVMYKQDEMESLKEKIIDMIEDLDEEQIDSVAVFLKFLQEKK